MIAVATMEGGTAAAAATYSTEYPPAVWIPASKANYTVANRPVDYPVDFIIIHDTEGTYASAIAAFQDPDRAASANYVVGSKGQIAQMVLETNIAWHAGNWDYNTRAIGIEHEGYAYVNGSFTTPEYQASEHLIASICSRWGVPINRTHVIGHYQVPDPNNPGLFGGSDHHTDPGPYWHWDNYIKFAAEFANALPSPPHMVLTAVAISHDSSVSLSWSAARTCHLPVASYDILRQPGNVDKTVSGSATSALITGLQNGTKYTFTVTAHNADGQSSLISNPVIPMTVPAPPTGVVATAAGGAAVVSWTAPTDDGGSKITGYVVTTYLSGSAPSQVTFMQVNNLEIVFNLIDGQAYTFTVSAINAVGPGPPSASSSAVTPSASLRPLPPAQAPAASPPAPRA